jgi:hypothetical protein
MFLFMLSLFSCGRCGAGAAQAGLHAKDTGSVPGALRKFARSANLSAGSACWASVVRYQLRIPHDLPQVIIRVFEVASVPSIEGLLSLLHDLGASRLGEFHDRINLSQRSPSAAAEECSDEGTVALRLRRSAARRC